MMKGLVVYYSATGNTKKVAAAIHRGMAQVMQADIATIKEISPEQVAEYDVVGIGSPIWFFRETAPMRQRVVAAMAMARSPKLLIADEPTTALDVTIQDQFLRLLKEMQAEFQMGLILVTHNLGIVAEVCDSVAIMYAGRIVESGSVMRVYNEPAHPYTKGLMEALPKLGVRKKRLYQIDGEPPDLCGLPSGCYFHPRCASAMDVCRKNYPPTTEVPGGGQAACWLLQKKEQGR
jgi:oligopeptide transport system ATP-binding protein